MIYEGDKIQACGFQTHWETDMYPKRPISSYARSDWPISPAFRTMNLTMAGPLMTSAVTLFGNRSLFAAANASTNATAPLVLHQICQENRLPFSAFRSYRDYAVACEAPVDDSERVLRIMRNFTDALFSDVEYTERYLSASMYVYLPVFTFLLFLLHTKPHVSQYFHDVHYRRGLDIKFFFFFFLVHADRIRFHANEAMLVQTAQKTAGYTARPLYTAPGIFLPKPAVSLAGTIVISMLMLLQLLGLAYLAWYIYQVPTWTGMLDALAIARITNSLDKGDIPALGAVTARDVQRLQAVDALVGVVETGGEGCSTGSSPVTTQRRTVELGLGASGLFSRRLTRFRVQRSAGVELDCHCEGCMRTRNRADSRSSTSSYY